ncbi:DUF3349 domain-containing protein [Williamsia maris]|uniref:DUF3349 domain-containing protein n=1 Tax=Williamsia maris TaxID=72806 RepID=A0ABT1HIS3_9NOCA|nr:DUF3349 domain-containing protein [Williamsia maris]MCP2177848.1 Protein of unknown function (DUF3349) [Williamsia maris]
MDRPQLMRSIMNWLRAGYPNGVPTNDYVPLMALLRRQLSDDEVHEISDALIADAADHGETEPISRVDVGVLITKVTEELPSEADIARVRAILEDAGWTFEAGQRGGTSDAS